VSSGGLASSTVLAPVKFDVRASDVGPGVPCLWESRSRSGEGIES